MRRAASWPPDEDCAADRPHRNLSLVTAAAGRGGAPAARAGKRLARRARPTMERAGSGWEWARLEAAPPEVGWELGMMSCGASGGAASCHAGEGWLGWRPHRKLVTRHSSLLARQGAQEVGEADAFVSGKGGGAVVEDDARVGAGKDAAEVEDAVRKGGIEGGRGFDFDGYQAAGALEDQVDFASAGVAVEPEGVAVHAGQGALEEFGDDQVFVEAAAERGAGDEVVGAQPGQPGGQSGVGEVDFRGLDDLGDGVAGPSAQAEHEAAFLQRGDPRLHRRRGDAEIGGQGMAVDDLPDAGGQQEEEVAEHGRVADGQQGGEIALEVGGDVGGEEAFGADRGLAEPGVEAAADRRKGVAGGVGGDRRLFEGIREKGEDGRAPRQGLGHAPPQPRLVGAREDETAGPAVGIDDALEVGEQMGGALDFVENGPVREIGQEAAGVVRGGGEDVGVFQGDPRLRRKGHPGQGGLARLAGAVDGDDGEFGGQGEEFGLDRAGSHGGGV